MALITSLHGQKTLATAIVMAAKRLGITDANQPMTGPLVLMLLNDIEGMATNVRRRSVIRQALTKDVVSEAVRKSDAFFRNRKGFPNDQFYRDSVEYLVDAICGKQDLSTIHYAKSYSVGPACKPDVDKAAMSKRRSEVTCHDCRAIIQKQMDRQKKIRNEE